MMYLDTRPRNQRVFILSPQEPSDFEEAYAWDALKIRTVVVFEAFRRASKEERFGMLGCPRVKGSSSVGVPRASRLLSDKGGYVYPILS